LLEFSIGPAEAGKKVLRYVRQLLPGVPLSGIHKMVRTGRVKRNGKRAKADDVLAEGDVIRLYMAEEDFAQVTKPPKKFHGVSRAIDVVYEDSDILIVNKPLGLLTHGAQGEHKDTLANRVLAYLYDKGELQSQVFTPSPVNRLDRNTSGLVVFGKTHEATRILAEQLRDHLIRKWYLAIVKGRPSERGEIDAQLVRDVKRNVTRVADEGKPARTLYERRATAGGTSVVKVELVSGRTHQIRAHFAHIGHPLWNDVKYGGRSRSGEHHQWLHAAWLSFPDGRVFHAPLPEAFRRTLLQLGYTREDVEQIERF
jgi:RluA family pseudouridine synthase